jgi:hypothetical protein
MKNIELTQGQVAIVDDSDFEYLNQWRWHARRSGKNYYAQRNEYSDGRQRIILMHRVIMNTPDGMQTDHIDHNGLNNQKNNLRSCSANQNRKNRIGYGTSSYLGVAVRRSKGNTYWIAEITDNGHRKYLGFFKDEKEAAYAYNRAAMQLHGLFAHLNDI